MEARGKELDTHLLEFLRDHLGERELAFAEAPTLIPGGSNVRVHGFRLSAGPEEFRRPLVLRVWRVPDGSNAASYESCIQNALVELGYPSPKVLLCCEDPVALGAPFQVMERAGGRPLFAAGNNASESDGASLLVEILPNLGQILLRNWPKELARLLAHLHELDAGFVARRLESRGFDLGRHGLAAHVDRLEKTIEAYDLSGLRPGIEWLRAHAPPDGARLAVCHGDLFPNQVFVERGRDTVLDWGETLLAPAEIDVGIVHCGLRTVPVPLPWPVRGIGIAIQRRFAQRFLAAYRALRAVDADTMRFGGVLRAVQTLVGVSVRRLALAGAIAEEPRPNPYDHPLGVQLLREYLESTASVEVGLPS